MLIDFDDEYASIRQWAKMYFDLGLQVVPAYKPGERDQWKRPALKNWTHLQKQKMSEEDFNQWWGDHGEYNNRHSLGFINGYVSGDVFTIDIDSYKDTNAALWLEEAQNLFNDGKLFNTPTQTTGGGGKQLLFRAPPGWSPPTSANPVMGIDIRGEGGFAMLPPSNHTSGKQYAWDDDYEPWTTAIMMAPEGFCAAIDELFGRFNNNIGGPSLTQKALSTVKMPTPAYKEDAFGGVIDGREDLMFRWVFKALVVLHIETNGEAPTVDQERESFERLCKYWIDKVDIQDQNPPAGLNKEQLLDRENRGPKLLWTKWRHTMQKHWTGRVAEAARNPREGFKSSKTSKPELYDSFDDIESEPSDAEDFAAPKKKLFIFKDMDDIENFVPPKTLVSGTIIENSLGFFFGAPGSGKTFVCTSLALSIAYGIKKWLWGTIIERHGPTIYISTEGTSDVRFRIEAWKKHHKHKRKAPFYLLDETVNFLDQASVNMLMESIKHLIQTKLGGEMPVAIFVDTVSRTIAGADENNQKDMTKFIEVCDKIRRVFKTTVIGVHHTGRQGETMRGSTVLDGAADWLMLVSREKGSENGIVKAEKIKAFRDGWEKPFALKHMDLGDVWSEGSLVATDVGPEPNTAPGAFGGPQETGFYQAGPVRLTIEERDKIIASIKDDWDAYRPWSMARNMKLDPRHAYRRLHAVTKRNLNESNSYAVISALIDSGFVAEKIRNTDTKMKGLKIIFDPRKVTEVSENNYGDKKPTTVDESNENND